MKEANGELLHCSKIKKTCRRLAGRFQQWKQNLIFCTWLLG